VVLLQAKNLEHELKKQSGEDKKVSSFEDNLAALLADPFYNDGSLDILEADQYNQPPDYLQYMMEESQDTESF